MNCEEFYLSFKAFNARLCEFIYFCLDIGDKVNHACFSLDFTNNINQNCYVNMPSSLLCTLLIIQTQLLNKLKQSTHFLNFVKN